MLFLILGNAMLVLGNAWLYGPPPLVGLFGVTREVRVEYGRLKGSYLRLRQCRW